MARGLPSRRRRAFVLLICLIFHALSAIPLPAAAEGLYLRAEFSATLLSGRGLDVKLTIPEAGRLTVTLERGDETPLPLFAMGVSAGSMNLHWDMTAGGEAVPPGAYTMTMALAPKDGSPPVKVREAIEIATLSTPYSDADDGSYWSMSPGEPDDRVIWEIMTQPITIYDDHFIGQSAHVYLKANPDGTGANVAQIHGLTQGLHVVGEVNEHGYALVEAFSNYDPEYLPRDADPLTDAYGLKRGYVKAANLRTVEVDRHIGLLVDILTQRLYVFVDGARVTELTISTGLGTVSKPYRETAAGEFITGSRKSAFWDEDTYAEMGLRYNGGSLIHQVPSLVVDGVRKFAAYEKDLGKKASGNCVRVPRALNPDGYNMLWLWQNLLEGVHYKVLIWNDIERVDTPRVKFPDPIT